jgi:hypothetical protein
MQAYLHIDHLLLQRHYRKPVEAQEGFATKLVLRISLVTKTPGAILRFHILMWYSRLLTDLTEKPGSVNLAWHDRCTAYRLGRTGGQRTSLMVSRFSMRTPKLPSS